MRGRPGQGDRMEQGQPATGITVASLWPRRGDGHGRTRTADRGGSGQGRPAVGDHARPAVGGGGRGRTRTAGRGGGTAPNKDGRAVGDRRPREGGGGRGRTRPAGRGGSEQRQPTVGERGRPAMGYPAAAAKRGRPAVGDRADTARQGRPGDGRCRTVTAGRGGIAHGRARQDKDGQRITHGRLCPKKDDWP